MEMDEYLANNPHLKNRQRYTKYTYAICKQGFDKPKTNCQLLGIIFFLLMLGNIVSLPFVLIFFFPAFFLTLFFTIIFWLLRRWCYAKKCPYCNSKNFFKNM